MITVVGLGFVGLTTALGFASLGYKVDGIDSDTERIGLIKEGRLPFHEPGLDTALREQIGKNFFVVDDIKQSVEDSDYIFFCVGTPFGDNGQADLSCLYNALQDVLNNICDHKFRVIIIKSTVPPTTTSDGVASILQQNGFTVGKDIGLANNPEFLREGRCWSDFMNPDRIVVGCGDERTKEMLGRLYSRFNSPFYAVSYTTSEFIKYLSNTMLATMISYSNEMSLAAYAIGDIDIKSAFDILHLDRRWSENMMSKYVYPGCGFGGYCLPKDINAFYYTAKRYGYTPGILENVIAINYEMPERISKIIAAQVDKTSKIGILGLSFKPGSDDVRDTPSAGIIRNLLKMGLSNIYAYDPLAMGEFRKHYDFYITYCKSLNEIYHEADVFVITTAWEEFSAISKDKPVFDFRYIL